MSPADGVDHGFRAQAIIDTVAPGLREFRKNYVQELEDKRSAAAHLP